MSQFHLGQKDEAQKTLTNALKAFDWAPAKADHREAWMYHILRREAEELVKGDH
jgi:serine/threonine-protein kinase